MHFDAHVAMTLFALIIAIPVHEFAHARSAVSCGDDTPQLDGRLTILPWDHFDPIGALMCIMTTLTGFGLGWGKPVRIDPSRLRSPRWDSVKIAVWGPISNLMLAVGFALPLRFGWLPAESSGSRLAELLFSCVIVNLSLFVFNLIPIHPLDGSKVLAGFLPNEMAYRYGQFMAQWGFVLLIFLLVAGKQTGLTDLLIVQPVRSLTTILIGV
jgi:Zn-dependent protease